MANFEQIKDVVLTYADKYAKAFAQRAPVKTGRLKNSYRGVAQLQDGQFSIQVFGEYYGPFQSYGVAPMAGQGNAAVVPQGINPPPRNGYGSFYQFRTRGGEIQPKRFIQDGIANVTKDFTADLEKAGVKDIEEFFKGLNKIKVS